MNFRTAVRAGLLFPILLSACSEQREPARTVSWYREHPTERNAVVERCANDPGALGREANCVNAKKAAALEDVGSFSRLPPMNLSPRDHADRTDR
jgi:hypothetical protein